MECLFVGVFQLFKKFIISKGLSFNLRNIWEKFNVEKGFWIVFSNLYAKPIIEL